MFHCMFYCMFYFNCDRSLAECCYSWLVSALQRFTWCEVLLRLLAADAPFELCFLPLSWHPETVWRDDSNSDRKSLPWPPPVVGSRSSPLCRYTADGGLRLRGSCSDDGGTTLPRSRESSTPAALAFFPASLSSSSSSTSWVVCSRSWSLAGDCANESSCSSSALARLYFVRRFWNQTFTCAYQSQAINLYQLVFVELIIHRENSTSAHLECRNDSGEMIAHAARMVRSCENNLKWQYFTTGSV